jgi:uroporphyrin-III C-methyltransferase
MKNNIIPKLTLVGAGPGEPDLITVKGIKALNNADAVLYDALVNTELLKHSPNAIQIFVGKRIGFKRYEQSEINELIVQNAFNHGHVVRLKGGDPFIFGRGSEEIQYAETFNIETAIVSGISSSLAVPASLGIPLTQRNVAKSFWVVTGTNLKHQLSKDVHLAAQSTATVVILMGVSKLAEIVKVFQLEDKGNLPVAIIQNGTTVNEKTAIGTIDSIQEISKLKKISPPAIIVIGEVVKHSKQLRSFYEEFAEVKIQSHESE